ncbi:TerD family protein [Methylobacter sp. Wu1]|uniref:TerD family protein n=1 Tax=Methylobacter sp. Wu1 TaxID=3119359 RepID=UPI002F92BD41
MNARKDLVSGQNITLAHHDLHVMIIPAQMPPDLALDTSAFLLNETEKVGSDKDFVFFNQPSRLDQGIELDCNSHKLTLHLDRVGAQINKIVFTSTIFQGNLNGLAFRDVKKITVLVKDFLSGIELVSFALDTSSFSETALIFAELYRHQGNWKFRAIGAGFVGGLEPLAKHYGVDVGEGEGSAPSPIQPASPPKPINLSKVTLEKKGQSISLDKKPQGQLGKINVNLNWNNTPTKSPGFFSRSKSGIDLDLGCLFEFQDGSIGGIQALGNCFGNFHQFPYIELDQDDRSGTSVTGENLAVNGDCWHLFRRVLIFAFIYEGIPNWSHADAVITIKNSGQADIEVRLDSHRNDQMMCAIAMLENIENRVVITKLVDYFNGHRSLDAAYGWGLNYAAGSK